MKRTRTIALAATTALGAAPALAQDGAVDLGTLVLSGGLSPVEAEAYGRSASVITADEIATRGITNVQDALRALPGVAVNGLGNNFTQVRIRGGEGNHTLILIDGVEAAGADGEYFLSGLETANIAQIEVLRGPQSVFYGSNASSGVINIITRDGGIGQEARTSLQFGAGMTATAFFSNRTERGGVSLNFTDARDDGWDFSGSGGEKDSTDRQTLTLKGDYLVTPDLKLGFVLRDSQEEYHYDSTDFLAATFEDYVTDNATLFSNRDERTASLYAELSTLDGRLTHRLSFDRTDNAQSYGGGTPGTTETDALKYRLSFGLDGQTVAQADHLLNLLIEHEDFDSSSNPTYGREATSVALEYRAALDNGLDLQAGARHDFNNRFDDATTWTLGLSYALENGIRLHGSAGTGTVAPSFFELFANAFGYTGNPNLTPEMNRSFDFGVELPILDGRGWVDVTYFNETLTDEISQVSTGPGTFSFENQAGDSTREGVELSGQIALSDTLDLRGAYTYLDARNPNGSVETRRPRHELSLGATWRAFDDRATFTADLRHVAGLSDAEGFGTFRTLELPRITTVDVAARYALTDSVTMTGKVANLFDDDAMEAWGYRGRPRTIYVGFDARF